MTNVCFITVELCSIQANFVMIVQVFYILFLLYFYFINSKNVVETALRNSLIIYFTFFFLLFFIHKIFTFLLNTTRTLDGSAPTEVISLLCVYDTINKEKNICIHQYSFVQIRFTPEKRKKQA